MDSTAADRIVAVGAIRVAGTGATPAVRPAATDEDGRTPRPIDRHTPMLKPSSEFTLAA